MLGADPAISGLTIGADWAKLQPSAGTSSSSFDWSDLDDAFAAAAAAHKPVQLILTPGFNSPKWLLNELPSCDPLFSKGSAPSNCGTVSFAGYPEEQRALQNMLPLPWNTVYQAAWDAFLMQLKRQDTKPIRRWWQSVSCGSGRKAPDSDLPDQRKYRLRRQPSGLTVDATGSCTDPKRFFRQ